jgi:hypothetical protein
VGAATSQAAPCEAKILIAKIECGCCACGGSGLIEPAAFREHRAFVRTHRTVDGFQPFGFHSNASVLPSLTEGSPRTVARRLSRPPQRQPALERAHRPLLNRVVGGPRPAATRSKRNVESRPDPVLIVSPRWNALSFDIRHPAGTHAGSRTVRDHGRAADDGTHAFLARENRAFRAGAGRIRGVRD